MKTSHVVIWLSWLIALLALVAAGVGLLSQGGSGPFSFETVRGMTVQIYGRGLYAYNTPIAALGFRAADAVTLVVAIPVLIVSVLLYRRGSLKGGLLLAGALCYFLYNYASLSFGAAYNNLFLVYVTLLSASMFALVLVLTSFEVHALPARFAAGLPRRGMSIFLLVSGVIVALIWLVLSVIPALLQGTAPVEAAYYTTFVTGVLDIGVIAPALIVAGVLLLRRVPVGYLLASTLVIFAAALGPNLAAGGIAQLLTGAISVGQAIGFTVPFVLLGLVALGLTIALLRNLSEEARAPR